MTACHSNAPVLRSLGGQQKISFRENIWQTHALRHRVCAFDKATPSRPLVVASSSADGFGNSSQQEPLRRRVIEDHPSYRREDMSEEHSRLARLAFMDAVSAGGNTVDLAEAALQIAAEDDALVSHSSVRFPVASFHKRLQRLADEIARLVLPSLKDADRAVQLQAILDFLYAQQNFRPPESGRSALPLNARVDHPGVWENSKMAYLNEALISKKGLPATLAIVLSDVLRRLLVAGAIDFVAKIEFSPDRRPNATVIPGLNRESALTRVEGDQEGSTTVVVALNTCTSDALAECLSYLKRAFWPWPWDARAGGGFRAAAKEFLDGAASAEAEAIARTARHRLERGIWTSPGAGDLRRALAAAERLVILRGNDVPEERRDLAVLYCHAGQLQEARAELRAYARLRAQVEGSTATGMKRQYVATLGPAGLSFSTGSAELLPDAVLADRLTALLGQVPMEGPAVKALDGEEALRRCEQSAGRAAKVLPLTW